MVDFSNKFAIMYGHRESTAVKLHSLKGAFMTSRLVAVKPLKTYAQRVNDKFKTHKDTYSSLEDRINEITTKEPRARDIIQDTFEEFRTRYPKYQQFSDMYTDMVGCGSGPMIKLGDLCINSIIQRDPDVQWLVQIAGKFDPFYVNPVRVYVDKVKGQDSYIVWDGQHTAIAMLMLAVYGFNLDITEALECQVPVSLYPGDDVAKIRDRFIGLNDGSMSKQLDKVDLYMQYVYAVRHNNSTNDWHKRMESIQTLMEKYGCFFTHEKFNDHDQPGAITRPSEIFPANRDLHKWPVEVIGNMLEYHSVALPQSPVETLEMDNLCHIFRAAKEQGIPVDSKYIRDFVKYLNKITGNTWHTNSRKYNDKHARVLRAYENWRLRQFNSDALPKRCNQTLVAPSWICAALESRGFPHALPRFTGAMHFDWQKEDLQ